MFLLVLGIVIWAATHLLPSAAPALRARLVATFGINRYKLFFTLAILLSLGLIIVGWRSIEPEWLYTPSAGSRPIAMVIVLLAFLIMGAYKQRGRINRLIRHPQLTGVGVWAVGHLIANGEVRSVVLFSGMLLWTAASIGLINRREGIWQKPAYGGLKDDIKTIIAGVTMYAVLLFIHRWITGIALL